MDGEAFCVAQVEQNRAIYIHQLTKKPSLKTQKHSGT